MIASLILAATMAAPSAIPRHERVESRLAAIQAQIDRTMDAGKVKRLNAEYARLQRELDERDMARIKANTTKLNDFLEER